RLTLRQPDPRLHAPALQSAELSKARPPDPLGQLRKALVRRPPGSEDRFRGSGKHGSRGQGGETGGAEEQNRDAQVLRVVRAVNRRVVSAQRPGPYAVRSRRPPAIPMFFMKCV